MFANAATSNQTIYANPTSATAVNTSNASNSGTHGSNTHKKHKNAFEKFLQNVKEGVRAIEGKPEKKKEKKSNQDDDSQLLSTDNHDKPTAKNRRYEEHSRYPVTNKRRFSQYVEDNEDENNHNELINRKSRHLSHSQNRVVFVDSAQTNEKMPDPDTLDAQIIRYKKPDHRLDAVIITN